jgi:predicted ArsR family transcriptional regulator
LSVLQNIEAIEGHEYARKIIKTVADNMAKDIQIKIKNTSSNIEESLTILNSISNELGFMSSFHKDDGNNAYSIISHNCIAHKLAVNNQDSICNGFHSRLIQKALEGKINLKVQLKECIALGDNYSRHAIAIK